MIGCEAMLAFLADALNGSTTLHTRKIDRHMERLRQNDWFDEIDQGDRYRRFFYQSPHHKISST